MLLDSWERNTLALLWPSYTHHVMTFRVFARYGCDDGATIMCEILPGSPDFLQSCETKSGTKTLGSRLGCTLLTGLVWNNETASAAAALGWIGFCFFIPLCLALCLRLLSLSCTGCAPLTPVCNNETASAATALGTINLHKCTQLV